MIKAYKLTPNSITIGQLLDETNGFLVLRNPVDILYFRMEWTILPLVKTSGETITIPITPEISISDNLKMVYSSFGNLLHLLIPSLDTFDFTSLVSSLGLDSYDESYLPSLSLAYLRSSVNLYHVTRELRFLCFNSVDL